MQNDKGIEKPMVWKEASEVNVFAAQVKAKGDV